jgi:steroid delta-isomerase-like uncharacterized protein
VEETVTTIPTHETAALASVQPYFDAWNRHDAGAIVECFQEGGTYRDVLVPAGVAGAAIGAYAASLWSAFPDLQFEIERCQALDDTHIMAQWRMRGTNTAPFNGLPPTGRAVELPGVDVIELARDVAGEPGPIQGVLGYFDSAVVPRQLGLKVTVQPERVGPVAFGTSAWASSGQRVKPGAYTITMLEASTPAAIEEVRRLSMETVQDMYRMPGFLDWMGIVVGTRMVTVTAWTHPDDSQQLRQSRAHQGASRRYYTENLSDGGHFVWLQPERFLVMARCPACQRMLRLADETRTCACGARLPESALPW